MRWSVTAASAVGKGMKHTGGSNCIANTLATPKYLCALSFEHFQGDIVVMNEDIPTNTETPRETKRSELKCRPCLEYLGNQKFIMVAKELTLGREGGRWIYL